MTTRAAHEVDAVAVAAKAKMMLRLESCFGIRRLKRKTRIKINFGTNPGHFHQHKLFSLAHGEFATTEGIEPATYTNRV